MSYKACMHGRDGSRAQHTPQYTFARKDELCITTFATYHMHSACNTSCAYTQQ